MKKHEFRPDSIGAYFRAEWLPLTFVTLSGLVYNIGLLAGPWYEGKLAQCLSDILQGYETAGAMAALGRVWLTGSADPSACAAALTDAGMENARSRLVLTAGTEDWSGSRAELNEG